MRICIACSRFGAEQGVLGPTPSAPRKQAVRLKPPQSVCDHARRIVRVRLRCGKSGLAAAFFERVCLFKASSDGAARGPFEDWRRQFRPRPNGGFRSFPAWTCCRKGRPLCYHPLAYPSAL